MDTKATVCACAYCTISPELKTLRYKSTDAEKNALDELFNMLQTASTDLGMLEHNVCKWLEDKDWLPDTQYDIGKLRNLVKYEQSNIPNPKRIERLDGTSQTE